MSIHLAHRVQQIKPSPTMAISAKAAQLKAQGQDIIALGMGEPDFDTPIHIKHAAKKAIDAGQTKYTLVDGIPALKQAIIEKFKRDNQLRYQPDQILVSCGAKQSLYNLFQALIDLQDEVIIPAPFWVSYPAMTHLAQGKPVIIPTDHTQHFKITPAQLRAAITPRTKLLILNNPSNPSGMCYSAAELKALAQILQDNPQIYVILDEIYEHILWTKEPFTNLVQLCPALFDRVIVINGVSKAYAMTGWRIGYTAGPKAVIQAMKKIQSHSTSNPCSIAQAAAIAALSGEQTCIQSMNQAYKARHDYVIEHLAQIPGFECLPSDGTFYSFPCVKKAIRALPQIQNDEDFCQFLLEKAKVAIVPGSAFGAQGYVRLTYATSLEHLKKAITQIKTAIEHP